MSNSLILVNTTTNIGKVLGTIPITYQGSAVLTAAAASNSKEYFIEVAVKQDNNNPITFNTILDDTAIGTLTPITAETLLTDYGFTAADNSLYYVYTENTETETDTTTIPFNITYTIPENTTVSTEVAIYEKLPSTETENTYIFNILAETTENEYTVISKDLETAFIDWEKDLTVLSTEDIDTIDTQYSNLDNSRILIYNAIMGLEDGAEKTAYYERYKIAASNQYTGYRLLLLSKSKDNYLRPVSVKNVGGNRPYLLEFMENISFTEDITAAIFFKPVDTETNGIKNLPIDYIANLTDARKLTFSNDAVNGTSYLFIKTQDIWKKIAINLNNEGKLLSVNHTAITIDNVGDIYNTPLHQAMLNLSSNTNLAVTIDEKEIEKTENITGKFLLTFPEISSVISDSNYIYTYKLSAVQIFKPNVSIELYTLTENVEQPDEPTKNVLLNKTCTTETQGTLILTELAKEFKYYTEPTEIYFIIKPNDSLTAVEEKFNFTTEIIAAENVERLGDMYTITTDIQQLRILDKAAALDHAIANTTISAVGDFIVTTAESLTVAVTTTYPKFLYSLDRELKVDHMVMVNKDLPVGTIIKLSSKVDDTITELGTTTITTENITKKFWFTDIIGESSVRETLYSKDDTITTYIVEFSNLTTTDYTVTISAITAYQGKFDTDAQHTLASTDIVLEITDKTALQTLITTCTEILEKFETGDGEDQVPESAYNTFSAAIEDAKVVLNDGDATITAIAKAVTDLQAALDTYKDFLPTITVDKTILLSNINNAQNLIDNTTVGNKVGNIPSQTYKDELQTAITAAQTVYDDTPNEQLAVPAEGENYQEIVNTAVDTLLAAIDIFQKAIITNAKYVEDNLSIYEQAATDFLENIRKKISI